jgi:hypothetical protein
MSRKKNCDVFMGLCGAYNEHQLGKCDVYSDGLCHSWIESDLRDRIAHCAHRNRMRDKALRKAIREHFTTSAPRITSDTTRS